MAVGLNDALPSKHDKTFYPSLIEIQNMIQQTEAAIETGVLSKLPTVSVLITWPLAHRSSLSAKYIIKGLQPLKSMEVSFI